MQVFGKSRIRIKPLFSSYLFAKFSTSSHLPRIQFARGVRRVLSADGKPVRVDDEVIEAIRARIGADGLVQLGEETWHPGMRVAIRCGPLRGLQAVFERELDDGLRVQLLLETVQYQARVFIEKQQLTVVD
jgi:transcription antitermination factor NusG